MAFAYLFEENFELGTIGAFNTETDTESRLDIAHYSTLSRIPGLDAPYRGAYCMRVNLANDGTPADALLQETDGFDAAADGTVYVRFALYISPDIVMATTDEFAVFQIWSSTNTVEGGFYLNFTTAAGLRLGIGETSGSVFKPISTGAWHILEMVYNVDNAGNNDGTIDAWLDGSSYTQVASLDQGAITSAVFGAIGQDAGTTRGYILFDEIVADDTRIGPIIERFPTEMTFTLSGHAFVGPGEVCNASLLSGAGTDCVVRIYDTDTAYVTDAQAFKVELKNTANNELVDPAGMPVRVKRGCYVQLTAGTTPRASVQFCALNQSPGTIRNWGQKRLPHPIMG